MKWRVQFSAPESKRNMKLLKQAQQRIIQMAKGLEHLS